ncbi:subtilisin family serine protease [Spirosoma lacussanchae]|nr:S8 family serine peptidase [Spirosoma lacussanchae]
MKRSNFGPSVDAYAYGVRITSTYLNGSYAILSGTSMAAPHVVGLLFIRGNKLPTRGLVTGDPTRLQRSETVNKAVHAQG